ncbi:restriction endonuclease subunit S [Breznakiella homolactica]|uniref:Restriction endonuclease subunit S n=1 Tax=Breznakiella homolactica TaxID=2798577 RepID=A0A7T8BAY7_9SPIR|nr:restriction endonuclease subunit S [Breznakiella homolactica]QQO08658.1 restriction endonuclease subunit S [Breznakiella homolactica]
MVGWEKKKISDIAPLQRGFDLPSQNIIAGKYPIVYSNGINGFHKYAMASAPGLVTGRSGTIGALHFIEQDYWPHNTTLWVTDFKGNDPKFIYYLYKSLNWKIYATGSGVPTLNRNDIHDTILSIPPLPEQRAIAAALSDVDSYIAALERLIAKKRNIKQGAMQELLKPKENWEEHCLNYYGYFSSGNGFPLLYQGEKSGKYPFYKVSDFNNPGNERFMVSANNYISQMTASHLKCNIIEVGAIIFAKIGAAIFLERKKQAAYPCCIDNNMMAFTVYKEKGDSKYFTYVLQSMKLGDLVTATALPSLSGKQIGEIIRKHPQKPEQARIAQILSDMDAEIDALTAQLTKAKLIKQGIMQELLTGRIRLVTDKTSDAAAPKAKVIPFPTAEAKPAAASSNKKHNQQFDDAVAFSMIVENFYHPKYRLGRVKIFKLMYLLRRYQEIKTAGFTKQAAGPYKSEARYKGGEKIAIDKGYVIETKVKGKEGFIISKGNNIAAALKYAEDWHWQDNVQWLISNFQYKTRDDLETLTTVDMAACELRENGKTVNLQSIKEVIRSNPKWKQKLSKPHFADANIAQAIKWSIELFGTEAPQNA